MKRFLYTIWTLFFALTILFANPRTAFANEGEGGHKLEAEVNGYHIALASRNEWARGENTVVVTLTDGMGMPLSNAEVEILIAPKSDGHAASETETAHDTGQQQDAMPGMDMGNSPSHAPMPGMDMGAPATEPPPMLVHTEEIAEPVSMLESAEQGMYMLATHFESSGKHDVHVMFHVNGEMLQADFIVEIPGTDSRPVVLWGFVIVNAALLTWAGMLKKQRLPVKGGQ